MANQDDSSSIPQELHRVFGNHPELRADLLEAQVVRVLTQNASLRVRYGKLLGFVDQIGAKLSPYTPCRPECDYCCHMPTLIFEYEAKVMAAASARPMTRVPYRHRDEVLAAGAAYVGKPCPFLKERCCSIYEQRPLICRVHHSLASDAEPCTKVNVTLQRIPMLDPDYAEVPYILATLRDRPQEPWGVIQEFFPVLENSGF